MQVALKIWRYDSSTGNRALKEYEIDAPEEATLLDCRISQVIFLNPTRQS